MIGFKILWNLNEGLHSVNKHKYNMRSFIIRRFGAQDSYAEAKLKIPHTETTEDKCYVINVKDKSCDSQGCLVLTPFKI